MCVIFTINHFVSFSRIVHLTRQKSTLKISRQKKCIRYSWFSMGRKKATILMCEKQKFHELFNKVLLFRASRDIKCKSF